MKFGLGYRDKHFDEIMSNPAQAEWFEALVENYMGLKDSGRGLELTQLKKIRQDYPVVFHGVSMNLGGTDPFRPDYLKGLQALINELEPLWVSDHLCWTSFGEHNSHDLLPFPFTQQMLEHFTHRIEQVQDILKRPLLVENISTYIRFKESNIPEYEFMNLLAQKTGCKFLIDINNIYVNAHNHDEDAVVFLNNINSQAIEQIHMAGHQSVDGYKIDTHDHPIERKVLDLYEKALVTWQRDIPVCVEWDEGIPEYKTLVTELEKIRTIHAIKQKVGSKNRFSTERPAYTKMSTFEECP